MRISCCRRLCFGSSGVGWEIGALRYLQLLAAFTAVWRRGFRSRLRLARALSRASREEELGPDEAKAALAHSEYVDRATLRHGRWYRWMPLGVAACALITLVYRGTNHSWVIAGAAFLLIALAALRVGTAAIVDRAARQQRPRDRQN